MMHLKQLLKSYCHSRNLNYVDFYEDQNWRITGSHFDRISDEEVITLDPRLVKEANDLLLQALDQELERIQNLLRIQNISKITCDNNNQILLQ